MESFETAGGGLDAFRAEISELMKKEPGHFKNEDFKLENLTGSDVAIWQEVKSGTLTKEELGEYAAEVKESGVPSRGVFLAMINNKALGLFLNREIEARRSKKQ
jgi:hypothetical protein